MRMAMMRRIFLRIAYEKSLAALLTTESVTGVAALFVRLVV